MPEEITLDQLKKALSQPNKALKKRALAIIYNEAIVEAVDLLKQFIGNEEDSELQILSMKVLQKIQEFSGFSEKVPPESLIPFLQSSDISRRLLALRALVGRRIPRIAKIIHQCCAYEKSPEANILIAKILSCNPHPGNLSLLVRFLDNPAPQIRAEAYRGIATIISGVLLPLLLQGLDDPSQELQMIVMRFVTQMNRKQIIEALGFMFSSEKPELSRLAIKVVSHFQGADILPILKNHVGHPDIQTAESIKKLLATLNRKGKTATSSRQLIHEQKSEFPKGETVFYDLVENLRKNWATAPFWILEPLATPMDNFNPAEIIDRIRNVFGRIRYLLTVGFICYYFKAGKRNQVADRACFRAIKEGLLEINTLQILRILGVSFPEPSGKYEIFPITLADSLKKDLDETFFEPFVSLQEGLNLLDEYPEEAEKFLLPAVESLSGLLKNLATCLESNRLFVKRVEADGLKFYDYWGSEPIQMELKNITNMDFPANSPVLISQDSITAISMEPFLCIDQLTGALLKCEADEHALWEFFKIHNANEAYLAFLSEVGNY